MIIGFNTKININTETTLTEFIVGSDLLSNLHKVIPNCEEYSNILILIDKNVHSLYGKKIIKSLDKTGRPIVISIIPSGEKSKDLNKIGKFVKPFFKKRVDRKSCLLAIGGGVTTDIGGFIASILLRGIDCICIPTTILGQIDAAIGGKTGVDLWIDKQTMYKNMIGTIRQPKMVISDIDTLATLPDCEVRSGLGEMIKYWVGWGKPRIEKIIKLNKNLKNKVSLMDLISQCQKIKIESVVMDPLDTKNVRIKLNLGHTIGHAIESNMKNLSHGECVALGIVVAVKISVLQKLLSEAESEEILERIIKVQLPTKINKLNITKVLKIMAFDKKGGDFVLIKKIGQLIIKNDIDRKTVISALKQICI